MADAIGRNGSRPTWPKRVFTLEEANALIPTLVTVLSRLRANATELIAAVPRFVALSQQSGETLDPPLAALKERVEALYASVEEDQWMIEALGVDLKGIEDGLVDFPTERDGRIVYLCWRLGEGAIAHWHAIDAGFAGRQPLEP